jgi:hypothetical protein
LPIGRASGVDIAVPVNLKAEILAMLAAGRAGADIARIFRVHHATISRIATEARTISTESVIVFLTISCWLNQCDELTGRSLSSLHHPAYSAAGPPWGASLWKADSLLISMAYCTLRRATY